VKARWINNRGGGRTSAPARDAAALHCKTLRALPVILGNCVIIGGIVLAILTARDNIFSAPELSSGKFDFRIAAVRPPLSLPKSVQFLRPTAIARRLLTARTPPGVARHRGVPA
jgi:hypothetical protein